MNGATAPLIWPPPVLAELVADQRADGVRFIGCESELNSDEMTDDDGYGPVLAFMINLRLPAAIPLYPDAQALWQWRAGFAHVHTPISVLALAALDALSELRADAITAEDGSRVVAFDHPGAIMLDTLRTAPADLITQLTGWFGAGEAL